MVYAALYLLSNKTDREGWDYFFSHIRKCCLCGDVWLNKQSSCLWLDILNSWSLKRPIYYLRKNLACFPPYYCLLNCRPQTLGHVDVFCINPKLGMTSNYLVWGSDGESDCQTGMKQSTPAQYVMYTFPLPLLGRRVQHKFGPPWLKKHLATPPHASCMGTKVRMYHCTFCFLSFFFFPSGLFSV